MSALQGKIRFRVYLETLGNGFLYSLQLNYAQGTPAHPYSTISELWRNTYNFGNPLTPQPVPIIDVPMDANAKAAKLKLVSTGHGWGNNNTSNAAEFHNATHHVWVNGVNTFTQNNWKICNPNPDGCQPQNGTWFHNRAGWCPGSIAPWFNYDMTTYLDKGTISMRYVFDQNYTDFCNADNPGCVSGVTCPDCNDGFNPHLIVSSYLITNGDAPLDGQDPVRADEVDKEGLSFVLFPNPATGILNLRLSEPAGQVEVRLINNLGQVARFVKEKGSVSGITLSLDGLPKGIYAVEVKTDNGTGVKRVVLAE